MARPRATSARREERPVEHGYLLLLVVFEHEATGDHEAASATGAAAGEIGKRFGGADVFALAVQEVDQEPDFVTAHRSTRTKDAVAGLFSKPSDGLLDPLLTIRSERQPVATRGNGFGSLAPFSPPEHLPMIATGCARWAPLRLHLLLAKGFWPQADRPRSHGSSWRRAAAPSQRGEPGATSPVS